jgi:hypothetical protein
VSHSQQELKRRHFRRSASYLGVALLLSSASRAAPGQALKWIVLAVGVVVMVRGVYFYVLAMRAHRAAKEERTTRG